MPHSACPCAALACAQVHTWRLAASQAATVAEEAQGQAELLRKQLKEVRGEVPECWKHKSESSTLATCAALI